MPELPEVETIRRTLAPLLVGRTITACRVSLPKVLDHRDPDSFVGAVVGRKIEDLTRRGKYLLFHLSGGRVLVVHLRMTGRLIYHPPEVGPEEPVKHTHVIFGLEDGATLHYVDPRRFGRLRLAPAPARLDSLGPEPLDGGFSPEVFRRHLSGRRRRIKALLLDQAFLAGLGNIYADEALYRARIHPERPADRLTAREARALYRAIREVLDEAIRYRGTSIVDYVDGRGRPGEFQLRLNVYGRGGEPCPACGTPIARTRVASRGTYFCPRCQPRPD
ncbi:MAG: bifunctional DNA-formamidopyrimidine glycosylase/DNA-(apurinic or apyrimidinic site) lyase [Firmicutes bacterium]|nr:bifunctional DNA-formamidopyrimidine glycosylase/DNA-(apurinic or apyrimidinic site) lyase [Bacillota bacterium]